MIGPNGSGKTTCVNLLTGFYKPDSGTITFQGEQIQGRPPYAVCRKGIARTFQIPKPLKMLTVVENVMVGHIFGRHGERKVGPAKARAIDILKQTGLTKQLDSPANSLTPSQCRRLEIARALATSPKLLLLDEVMAGLSTAESEELVELVRSVRNSGVTIFMIEHVMRIVMSLCERLIVLNFGEKICEGSPEKIKCDANVVSAYLGSRGGLG